MTETTFGQEAEKAIDKDRLKELLPLEYVALEEGIALARQEDGRLTALCPFHDDTDPSFDIFGEDLAVWGCFPCGVTGDDLYALLMRTRRTDFPGAVAAARQLFEKMKGEGFEPSPPPPPRNSPDFLRDYARSSWETAQASPGELALALSGLPNIDAPPEWLQREFHLGFDSYTHEIVIPFFAESEEGPRCVGVKTRLATTHPYAKSGSTLNLDLYGGWRDSSLEGVILCEGESDTWRVAWLMRGQYDVFGLPSGAGVKPKDAWIERLAGRDVTLLFDADTAGRKAARIWYSELVGKARTARVVRLPDGMDARKVSDPAPFIERAASVPPSSGYVQRQGPVYLRTTEAAPMVANWSMVPTRVIELLEGGQAIEGLLPDGRSAVIADHDLSSDPRVTAWSNRHGYAWYGTKKDAQAILDLLLRQRAFLPTGQGTTVAGWHKDHFVLPGLSIGPEKWVYIPPQQNPGLEDVIRIEEKDWDRTIVRKLLELHDRTATGPILAWLAVAPIRSLFSAFPSLYVAGSSGSGKTTLLETMLGAFGWGANYTLTGTTAYAVTALLAGSNGVPVWFDEYRPGARRDAKLALDQGIRDSWTGQSTVKGGLHENVNRLTSLPASAPLIVSGEDLLQEQSHVERSQVVNLTRAGRNDAALREVYATPTAGLGFAYLSWLVHKAQSDVGLTLKRMPVTRDRQEVGAHILREGWELLSEFTGEDLGELDLSGTVRNAAEASSQSPYLEATLWALSASDRQGRPLAWIDEDRALYVRTMDLVVAIERDTDIALPGKSRAMVAWLEENYGRADRSRQTENGRAARLKGAGNFPEFESIDARVSSPW